MIGGLDIGVRGSRGWVEIVSGRPMKIDDEFPRRYGEVAAGGCDAYGLEFRPLEGLSVPERFSVDADLADFALHAGLALGHQRVSLADTFVGSAALLPPSLIKLAERADKSAHRTLRARVVAKHARPVGLTGLLLSELAFQGAVVDALGGQTLITLMSMLHRLIEVTISHMESTPGPVVRHLAEVKLHDEIVRLVEAGRGQSAAALAHVRTKEVEAVIREYDAAAGTDELIRIPPADR